MRLRRYLLAAAAAVLAACTAEVPETPEFQEVPGASPTSMVLHAVMDGGTRTSVVMNGAGTHADVVWNAGDKIRVFGVTVERNGLYSREFTTSTGGSSEADFASDNWAPSSDPLTYLAFYPAERYTAINPYNTDEYMFGIGVPPVQTAVNGGIENGLNIAVSYTGEPASKAGSLHFKNILSLVHFRLDGAGASRVRKAVLQTSYTVAGNGVFITGPGGEGYIDMGRYYTSEYDYSYSITLEGSFEAGGDYYFALVPGVSEGFSLRFLDENGDFIIKTSEATLNARRSHILELGTISIGNTFSGVPEGVEQYMTQTQGTKPVDLVVLGDGFTASEQTLFGNLAHSAIDKLFATEPFKTYKDWFNVYIIPAVSNESGASVTDGSGNITDAHDTYFGSRWGADSYGDMDADRDKIFSFVSVKCPEVIKEQISVDDVSVLLIINDTRYGGICYQYPYGRTVALVPYTDAGANTTWAYPSITPISESDASAGCRYTTQEEYASYGYSVGNWTNVVLHEFGGHGFGRLADEYWGSSYYNNMVIQGHSWPVPTSLNISSTYDNVPWKTDLLDNLAVMSLMWDERYGERIGVFQGAGTSLYNCWRSEKISCMIDNRAYYSTWQRVLIVKRLMELGGGVFDMEAFLDSDDPTDPVRDLAVSSTVGKGVLAPAKIYPPLPPPVMVTD